MITAKTILKSLNEAKVPPAPREVIERFIHKMFTPIVVTPNKEGMSPRLDLSGTSDDTMLEFLIKDFGSNEEIDRFFHLVKERIGQYGWYGDPDTAYYIHPFITLYPNYTELADNIPRYIFHFTNPENVERILKRGLIPKTGSDWHGYKYPPRNHFFYGYDEQKDAPKGGTILRIDTTHLGRNVKFYKDTQMSWRSVWTYAHIPPEAISIASEGHLPRYNKKG